MTTRKRNDSSGTTPARGVRRGRPPRENHYRPAQHDDERPTHETATPHELYRHEKARRLRTRDDSADPLADAKREYTALLAAEAARGKGGRPRKNAARPATPASHAAAATTDDVELEADELEVEVDPADDADEGDDADEPEGEEA